jgi:predicted acylesterase/phospholipase RssA
LLGIAARLARALPVGLFDNEPIRDYLERVFDHDERTDDFRRLARRLVVVAADLDSGEAALFGEPGLDHVPISVAVQASTALPGLYPPVAVGDRYYVDGVLLKTLHGSVAIDAGAQLVLCVNPIVPVDTERAIGEGVMRRGKLVHRGLPTVLAQTFRTLVRSRLSAGMAAYIDRYPDTDVVLVEPRRDDYRMFFTNVFRFSSRRSVCEHAYRATLEDLSQRRDELEPVLARHGIRLRHEVLNDPGRDMWTSLDGGRPARRAPVAERLHRTLARLDAVLEERGSTG